MKFDIIGKFDPNQLYCAGSLTKLLTTFTALSLLSEQYHLASILDDPSFLDSLAVNAKSRAFLDNFQKHIGSQFSIRDLCSYYTGLPYTFDLAEDELDLVEQGYEFKHHSILDEATFISRCQHNITPVYKNRCKFHYSEVGIIFLAYFLECRYEIKFEDLYQRYVIRAFDLNKSIFSRSIPADAFIQDLSDRYDYPSIAITNHGYFAYSNGFYTTLNEMRKLLDQLINTPVFTTMVDVNHARGASAKIMNGLTVEIRSVGDDLIYGYEGLSFSGCNLWAYSTKKQQGYLTFDNSEEEIYNIIYDEALGNSSFDVAPAHTQLIYKNFLSNYHEESDGVNIPAEYQGNYHRVNINAKTLDEIFVIGKDFFIIRNPERIKYEVIHVNGEYWIKGKDGIHGTRLGLYLSKKGHHYMFFDGSLYKKI